MNLRINFKRYIPAFVISVLWYASALAGEATLPNTFTAGTPAVAAQVNANFTAVKTAVDDNNSRVAALEALVAALQSRLETLEASQVMALDPYLTVDETTDTRGPLLQLSGVNLQIVNGLGSTDTINGLGNIIIGYDEVNTDTYWTRCSDGEYYTQESCESADEIWDSSLKTGSHYLVLGSENNYSQYGGLVAGFRNFAIKEYSTITGGHLNFASGLYSSVSGGRANTAHGSYSSVSGGNTNNALGDRSSISGGINNQATGDYSSISGGNLNTASGPSSSVSGGHMNTASGAASSVCGGEQNETTGENSSIGGGYLNTASGGGSSVSGGHTNTASGAASSVSGGNGNMASGNHSSVSGGEDVEATGIYDWAAGSLYEN